MAIENLICEDCLELDQNTYTRICARCPRRYCRHYASDIDIAYCNTCMVDIQVTIKDLEARKAREIKLEGSDLFFAEKSIKDTPEHMIDLRIEYHRYMYHGLLLEKQEQKIRRMANLPKVKLMSKPAPDTKAAKATKAKKQTDPLAAVKAAMTLMLGKTPTDAEVMAFLLKNGGIKN